MTEPVWLTKARSFIGFHEQGNNQGIQQFVDLSHCGAVGDPWCAIFANACLESSGYFGSRSAMARSFERDPHFTRLDKPTIGCLVTMIRGSAAAGTGHVTFCVGEDNGKVQGLGGNQKDSVCIETFAEDDKITGYWWPNSLLAPAVDQPTAPTAPSAPDPTFPELNIGSTGDAVRRVQAILFVDGEYGPITQGMVKAFQRANGLAEDGIVGQNTWAKLAAFAGQQPPAPPPSPGPVSPAPPTAPTAPAALFSGITATEFGGASDPNTSAYDKHRITDTELGVALPYHFAGTPPRVRVHRNGQYVDCNVVDVGPWNINDPYWTKGGRPQAESGVDTTGRHTNRAGIDLTPAVAKALGINGMGAVDWEFISEITTETSSMATTPAAPVPVAPVVPPAPPAAPSIVPATMDDFVHRALQTILTDAITAAQQHPEVLTQLLSLISGGRLTLPLPGQVIGAIEAVAPVVAAVVPKTGMATGLIGLAAAALAWVTGSIGAPVGEMATVAGTSAFVGSGLLALLGGTGTLSKTFGVLGNIFKNVITVAKP